MTRFRGRTIPILLASRHTAPSAAPYYLARFTLAAACSRNCEVESAPAPAHRIPKTGSIKVSKRCGGGFPAAIYLVERNAAHAAMRARTAMAGGVVPQGEAQKLTPMPNSPFFARWCKGGGLRPPLG